MSTENIIKSAILIVAICTGCSVKESREECPSFLNVTLKSNENVSGVANLYGWTSQEVFRGDVDILPEESTWVRPVHKEMIILSAVAGRRSVLVDGHRIVIPYGQQVDSLYANHQQVDCTGEEAFADVVFQKQFCTVHLDINQTSSNLSAFRFEVDGNSSGFDLLDFSVCEGPYHFEPVPVRGARVVDFRVPRQKDESLTVRLSCLDPSVKSGEYVDMGVVPLGEYIAKTGYDWSAEALQDIYVRADFQRLTVTVSVADWEDGVTFKLIEQ